MAEQEQTTPDLDSMMRHRRVGDDDLSGSGPAKQEAGDTTQETREPAREESPDHQEPEPQKTTEEGPESTEARKVEETPAPAKPRQDYRFGSHDEAEKAYKEIQSRVTKEEMRRADLKRELEKMQTQIEEMEAADLTRRNKEKLVSDVADYSETRHQELMEGLAALDPEDPKHTERAARLWAAYHRDLKKFELDWQGEAPAPKAEKKEQEQDDEHEQGPAEPSTESMPSTPPPQHAAPPPAVDETEVLNMVHGVVRQAGIEPDDPIFSFYASRVNVTDDKGAPIPLGNQIQAAIDQTKKYKADELSKLKQSLTQPMGRGGPGRSANADGKDAGDKPTSMDDALEKAREARRL